MDGGIYRGPFRGTPPGPERPFDVYIHNHMHGYILCYPHWVKDICPGYAQEPHAILSLASSCKSDPCVDKYNWDEHNVIPTTTSQANPLPRDYFSWPGKTFCWMCRCRQRAMTCYLPSFGAPTWMVLQRIRTHAWLSESGRQQYANRVWRVTLAWAVNRALDSGDWPDTAGK